MNTIAKLLSPKDVLLNIEVSNKNELFREIGRHMQQEHALSQECVTLGLSRREQVGSTGIGEGVAIPHARVKDLAQIRIAYVRLKSPIPFGAQDGKPVSDVLVILVPKQATEEHLRILAEAVTAFSDRHFCGQLHVRGNPEEVKQLFSGHSATPV